MRTSQPRHAKSTARMPRLRHRRRAVFLGATVVALAMGTLTVVGVGLAGASLQSFSFPTQSPNPIVPGQTATYPGLAVTDTNGSSTDYASLTYGSGLPSGATFSDLNGGSPECVKESSGTYTFNDVQVTTTSGVSPTE